MDPTQTQTDRTDGSGPAWRGGRSRSGAPPRRPEGAEPRAVAEHPLPAGADAGEAVRARRTGAPASRRRRCSPPPSRSHGLSGAIRRLAYRYPDHHLRHWSLLLLGDRVDAWGTRSWRFLRVAVPGVAVLLAARAVLARR